MTDIADYEVFSGAVYTSFFVHYDNEGTVYLISNVKNDTMNNYEIKVSLIPNFISGMKDCTNYKIEYFYNINSGLITDKEEQTDLIKTDYLLYEVPCAIINDWEILLEHDSTNHNWILTVSVQAMNKLEIINNVSIYVCKKDNPYYLITSHVINAKELIRNSIQLPFSSELENKFDQLTIYTTRQFREYLVKEKNDKN
jgi:hypothetical protein